MQSADELRERLIESHQTQIEVDEPEDDSMALLMGGEADKPAEDDMSEEKLLRALMAAQGKVSVALSELDAISAQELAALIKQYNPKSNSELIVQAYNYGREKHEGQYRKSGEPYFTHPIAVAQILAEQRLDDATIITALLHDTIEDTESSKQEIAQLFSFEVAELVDGVTKLTKMQLSSIETKEAENLRKLFLAIAQDIRVILVKLADRLHNMRTIRAMKPEKQVQKARETMEIFAPLAGRMGMQSIREDLEDLSFRVLNSEGRQSIIRRFVTLQKETGDVIERIKSDMLLSWKRQMSMPK